MYNFPEIVKGYVQVFRLMPKKETVQGDDYFLWKQETEGRIPCQRLFDGFQPAFEPEVPDDVIQQMEDIGMSQAEIDVFMADMADDIESEGLSNIFVDSNGEQIELQYPSEGIISMDKTDGYIWSLAKATPNELCYVNPITEIEEIDDKVWKIHNKSIVGIMNYSGEVEEHLYTEAPAAGGFGLRSIHWNTLTRNLPTDTWTDSQQIAGTAHGSTSGRKEYAIISANPDYEGEVDLLVDPLEVSEVRVQMNVYIRTKMSFMTKTILNTAV